MTRLRIASLLSSATEMLYGLGLGERVVGVSHECDWPPEAAGKPRCTRTAIDSSASCRQIDEQVHELLAAGSSLYSIDAELLATLRPDLIVTQAQCDVCAVRLADVLELVAVGGPLAGVSVVSLNPRSLGDVLCDVGRIAEAAGAEKAGRDYVARLQARIDAVGLRTASLPAEERPRVACLEWLDPLMIAANWMPELIELAGGRQSLTQAGQHSTTTAWERVFEFDPQVVLVMPCGLSLSRSLEEALRLADTPGWRDLAAVRAGRVYAVDANALFNRAGPRLVDSLELLAGLLQPDNGQPPGQEVYWQPVA